MRSATVGIFGDENLAGELGKKGTSSDITLYNRKTADTIYTFVVPSSYPDKLSALLQSAGMIDAAVLCVNKIDAQLGETVVALDYAGVGRGVLVLDGVGLESVSPLLKDTCLKNYAVAEKSYSSIMENLAKLDFPQKEGSVRVCIDHAFEVKSVGTVALGTVRRGKLLNHASLRVFPLKKDVQVRSIQMQDENVEEAGFGSRVGVAVKGVGADELSRGCVLAQDAIPSEKKLEGSFEKNKYYRADVSEGKQMQVLVGMQYVQAAVEKAGEKIALSFQKDVSFEKGDTFILADGGAKGLRIAGRGKVS